MMADGRVEAFEFPGRHFPDETRAFGKYGSVSGQIIGESDFPFRLREGGKKVSQVFGPAPSHMNAEDAPGEMTQRYPEPAFVFFLAWMKCHISSSMTMRGGGPGPRTPAARRTPPPRQTL